jgi:nucleotide-binding universal stress UspA family protein
LISKILLPHDGTDMSDKALEKAVELAQAFKSQLILLHIIEQVPVPPSIMLGGDTVLINRARRSVRSELGNDS